MVYGRKILRVFSVYAPQQGRPDEEKREFLDINYQIIYTMPSGGSLDGGKQYDLAHWINT